jgi:Tfp pilus assembly protein PilP
MLQAMSDEDYKKALADYKDILKDAAEIKMTKTPLQKDYQSIHLTGVISIKKEKVALFETLEKQGYSVRKGDIIGPNLGSVDDIQFERVIGRKSSGLFGQYPNKKTSYRLIQGRSIR